MPKSIATHIRLRGLQPSDGRIEPGGVTIEGKQASLICGKRSTRKTWSFDVCHDEHSGQEKVFEEATPLVESVFEGKNAAVIAYGVTGSGKTHTMEGTTQNPGLIRRSVGCLVAMLEQAHAAGSGAALKVSFVEILKDQVYDLLGQRADPPKLQIKTDARGNNVIDNLTKHAIGDMNDFERLFAAASKMRKTASTKLNTQSSRSHAVLTVYTSVAPAEGGPVQEGQLWLADLAGSEKNSMTGNTAERMQESKFINSSLTSLSRVIDAIRTKSKVVPHRDCKLTRILQPALGGTSKAILICCLAPGAKYTNDTVNTLDFADRTKQIEDVSVFAKDVELTAKVDPENRRLSMPLSRPGTALAPRASLAPAARSRPASALGPRGILNHPSAGVSGALKGPALQSAASNKLNNQGGFAPRTRTLGDITNRRYSEMPTTGQAYPQEKPDKASLNRVALTTYLSTPETEAPFAVIAEDPPPAGCLNDAVAGRDDRDETQRTASEADGMTDAEKAAKARAYVKEARKRQAEGNLELARKLFQRARPFIKDDKTVIKRIYALEAEILSRTLGEQQEAAGHARGGQKRVAEGQEGHDGDIDMEGAGIDRVVAASIGAGPAVAPGWKVAALRGASGVLDVPSPAKRFRM